MTVAWSVTPPLLSVVRTVNVGAMSVDIGFRTLLNVNCKTVLTFLPDGPIIIGRVSVWVLASKVQAVATGSARVRSMHFRFFRSVRKDSRMFSFSTLNHQGKETCTQPLGSTSFLVLRVNCRVFLSPAY